MLVLKKSFNVSIAESVGHPLAFPLMENPDVVMKDRVPYVEHLHKNYNVNETAHNLPDEVVAIESAGSSLTAMHADHLDQIYHIPVGI
ncbi:hypothetical protein Y032_0018g3729 [Ancylostoma ceylanicum]|nr:hypothetical protein Y032_0018g3729 [Ancylostoma ceylanicum]